VRTPLSADEIAARAPEGWTVVEGKLTQKRDHISFLDAVAYVQQVAIIAEELDHHPDIDIRWRTTVLAVNTHDAGNAITGKDIQLAERVEAMRIF
jgi:4a-hydroxytetrahydrobiopterin dehydratase